MASAKQQPNIDQKKEVIAMPLVKVKEKYQVTIPTNIREKLALKVGDVLEADIEKDKIVLKPQLVVDKAQAWKRFQAILKEVHEKNKDMSDEEVMKDALEAVHEVRKLKRHAHGRR
ncbi:AbrB/MazE/SpoVT family DNA-binding domain-containing protein [Candidatus Acetothermia bacterium]|nr:AbrB/MazE/SpoVT family DNA-binding domain-containing protein [Candidatus Acetothermia bacterium]